jgi:hypothetical protein
VVPIHVRDVVTRIITLSGARRHKWVKLIMQLVHLLMKVVIAGLCIHNTLLKLSLSSSEDIFPMPIFVPLVEHMNK